MVNGRDAGRCLLDLIGVSSIRAAFKTFSREEPFVIVPILRRPGVTVGPFVGCEAGYAVSCALAAQPGWFAA